MQAHVNNIYFIYICIFLNPYTKKVYLQYVFANTFLFYIFIFKFTDVISTCIDRF